MSIRIKPSDKERLLRSRTKILRWFSRYGRSFFWRKVERNPYRVLVTEFMLQQTQTFRVEEFLPKFLKRFPTLKVLAKANSGEVIRAWQGLGYNRRALNLQRTAQKVSNEFEGTFPHDDKSLMSLPGIGEYTMRALQVFAFGKRVSVVDVNVARVLSRLAKRMPATNKVLATSDVHKINEMLLPRAADKWHEALMDLGATICKTKPQCSLCPVQKECASFPILANAKHSSVKKNPNEKIYFGKPKRIWRGLVLKVIAERKKVSYTAISSLLATHTVANSRGFADFIHQVANELAADGLCKHKGNYFAIE